MTRIAYEPPPGTRTHPLLDLFPMMTEREFAGLTYSIKKHGQVMPISRDKTGVILDGRCRFMACMAAGVEPKFETVDLKDDDDDVRSFIVSANIARMHHNPSQQAIAEALVVGRDPENPIQALPEARLVAEHPDLVQEVMAGRNGLNGAYEKITAPIIAITLVLLSVDEDCRDHPLSLRW
jgi:hypothetical protein